MCDLPYHYLPYDIPGYSFKQLEKVGDPTILFASLIITNHLILANRRFDKVIVVQRPWQDILEACCWYDKQIGSIGVILDKKNDDYVKSLIRNYNRLYKIKYNNKRIYYVNIEDFNKAPVQEFKKISEFLGFNMKKFPVIVPIKVQKDWEVYAGYNNGLKLNGRLKLIKEAKKNEK